MVKTQKSKIKNYPKPTFKHEKAAIIGYWRNGLDFTEIASLKNYPIGIVEQIILDYQSL